MENHYLNEDFFCGNSKSESVLLNTKLILFLGELSFQTFLLLSLNISQFPWETAHLQGSKQTVLSGIAHIKESSEVKFHSTDFIYQFGFAITAASVFFH